MKPWSGFGYCIGENHYKVDIFKEDDGYVVQISYFRSDPFKDIADLWKAVKQVEEMVVDFAP